MLALCFMAHIANGSAPMCFAAGDLRIGQSDVLMGEFAGYPFYMSRDQFEYWRHTQLIIDVVSGRGASFSLEIPELQLLR